MSREPRQVALAVFGATFPLLFQAMYGIADVDPVATDTARAFRMGWSTRLGRVVLPSCAPYLATGLRMYALILAAGLLGVGLNLGFHALERWVLFWHPSHRPVEAGAA
jgi:ABC-type nitrate/sulfonate/bicarbonate transport system permease component